jgi:hypothetical protein
MEIVGGGNDREKKTDQAHHSDGGKTAAAVFSGKRNLPATDHEQRYRNSEPDEIEC